MALVTYTNDDGSFYGPPAAWIETRLKITNVALDEDGVPYFQEGATAAQILLDPEDNNPYFVITS